MSSPKPYLSLLSQIPMCDFTIRMSKDLYDDFKLASEARGLTPRCLLMELLISVLGSSGHGVATLFSPPPTKEVTLIRGDVMQNQCPECGRINCRAHA